AQRIKATRVTSTLLLDAAAPRAARPDALTARALVEGALLGPYSFDRYRTNGTAPTALDSLAIVAPKGGARALGTELERGRIFAEASCFARDLVAEPAVAMTPTRMAEIASGFTGVAVKVF